MTNPSYVEFSHCFGEVTSGFDFEVGEKVNVIIRPENVKISKTERKLNCLSGKIYEQIYDGAFTKILIKIGRKTVKVIISGNDRLYSTGDIVYFYWTIEDVIVLRSENEE